MRGWRTVLAVGALTGALASCGRDQGGVRASGTIEMDEVDVSSMVGGRIAVLRVTEGDTVGAGDTLVRLDRGEVAAALEAQAAESGRAQALWRDQLAGPRAQELEAARAELQAAQSALALAESELQRVEALAADRVAAPADLDRARSSRDAAVARRDGARERLGLLEAGARRDQLAAARAAAVAARAEEAAARSRFGELVLTAPISGVVLLKNAEVGEVVGSGVPVLTLGDPDRLWIRVYVPAPQIGRVRLGAPAELRAQGFGARVFTGHVVEIATRAEFTPRAALTEEERANLVFAVKIVLDPTGGALKAGLPADARIADVPAGVESADAAGRR